MYLEDGTMKVVTPYSITPYTSSKLGQNAYKTDSNFPSNRLLPSSTFKKKTDSNFPSFTSSSPWVDSFVVATTVHRRRPYHRRHHRPYLRHSSIRVIHYYLNYCNTKLITNGAEIFEEVLRGNGIVDWTNDDLARVKGKEKGDYTRCVGPNIRLPRSKRSRVAQVPMLKARINELELEMKEMKDLKERQHIEMKEMKENQAAILQFMAKYKIHNSNEDFSNVLNTTNTKVANDSSVHNPGPSGKSTSTRASETKKSGSNEDFSNVLNTNNTKVANDSSSVHNPGPYGKSTSTRAREIKKSDKAVTSPLASEKITHLNSAEMQLRKKFLEEDSELMKFHQQLVMGGFMSDNEFWCIRKVKQRVINCHQTLKTLNGDDALLLRKFGIQFKADQKQVQLQLSEKSATTRSAF